MDKKSYILGGTAINMSNNRLKLDQYYTPPYATKKLLENVELNGTIWEPACGMGHISKVLEENGHSVYSSDISSESYGDANIDFLNSDLMYDNIITNPPYSLAGDFISQGLSKCNNKLILLLRLAYLESQARYTVFKTTPLQKVLVMSKRLEHWNGSNWERSGQFSHAWFIWDKNHNGKTQIDWAL